MEKYTAIEGFPDYEVSNFGNIRGKKGKILAPAPDQKGYLMVGLRRNSKTHTKRIARLVAQAFIPNPTNKAQVNHKDGNRANNHVDNLEWNTGSENISHAYMTLKRRGSQEGKLGSLSPFAKRVIQQSSSGEEIKIWGCMKEAAEYFGVRRQSIYSCIKGKCKTIKGFKWKFYE